MGCTSVSRQALLPALVAVLIQLAAGSHFRGGIVQWRPVDPVNFDGRIVVTHRIAWRRGTAFCDANTIAAGSLIGQGGDYSCRSGCSGSLGTTQFRCTDFNVDEDWSTGENSNTVTLSGVTNFEASYTGGDWITLVTGGGGWEVRVKGNLSPRSDNGRINSSPTTAVSPVFRLRHGVTHTITIPVSDADGDVVRCRWATSSQGECAGVCGTFPATIDQNNCRLTYNANGATGWYAAAIQVEDFISSSSTTPLSSVPVQFLVLVQVINIPPGVTNPTFVGTTPADGSCITVGSTYSQQITARSGGATATIADISTVSPPGLTRSALTTSGQDGYITVTWTPSASQQGANIFCYTASDNYGLTSSQVCITLVVGVAAPQLTSVVLRSFRNGQFELTLQYDQSIARPSFSSFIRIYRDDGALILSHDVSSGAVYSGSTVTLTTSTSFFTTRSYYLLADSGVAVATAFCAIPSPAITSTTQWTFGVTDTTCAANHYLDPSSPAGLPICIPCPSNSVSGGGNAVSCTCNSGTGRVNENDVTLPCLACPGAPASPSLSSGVPPTATVSWSSPSSSGWSFTYEVAYTNGNNIAPRQSGTTAQIPGLQAQTQYSVVITAFPVSTVCPSRSTTFTFTTSQRCPSPAPSFSGSPTVQPGLVRVSWSAVGSSDPLVTGVRYALYSRCGSQTSFQMIVDITGLSYDVTTLPTLTQCVLRVVAYSDHCPLNPNGGTATTTGTFTTVCSVNQYVASGACVSCPTNSVSPGGTPSSCTCNAGTGRVNEADVSLPCLACPGAPASPNVVSDVPPTATVSWSSPSSSGWSFTYEIRMTNGNNIVPRQSGTTAQIPGLQAETSYTVVIFAFPVSTLCPSQSRTFTFMTSQRCPSPPPMFSAAPTVQPGLVRVSWTAAGSSDPLVTGIRYALYSRCGTQTTFQMIHDLPGLSYDITTLPTLTQCRLRVVVYSDHCLLDVNGPLEDTTDPFTPVCRVNEYIASGACVSCPTNSASPGGTPTLCNCNSGTGRVDDSDVSLPCFACPGPPEAPTVVSDVPPHVDLSWSRPSANGAWMYMYEVSYTNGNNIVPRQSSTAAQIPGLQAETQYSVVITAFPVSNLCPDQSTTFTFMTSQRCPSPPPMFSAPPTILPGLVRVSWTAAGSSDPLVTGIRYALYSRCGSQTTFQLIDDITGLSYDITTLPTLTQCTLRVVVYGDHCLLDVNGSLEDTTDPFTTVCRVNEYVASGACVSCPTNSTSPGGTPNLCNCNFGTGRVDDSDVSLPCFACPGPPEAPTVVSDVPPHVDLSWSHPSATGAWMYMYEVSYTNGSNIVPRQSSTTAQIPGLQAETSYTVVITAFPVSNLCPDQSTTFTFMTSQRCPSPPPMFSAAPTILPGLVRVSWTAAGSSDPLVTGIRYALYSQCGAQTTFQLIDDITGLSYDITILPTLTQCVLRVVVYSDHCLLDVNGPLEDTTDPFTTVCRVNEYVYPGSSPGLCAPCPANSVSGGGTPSLCTCNTGTGRVNDTDVTLPCLVCPGPPEASTVVSDVPPHVDLSWSRPSATGAWMYMYEVSWTNGSNIVPRQSGITAEIPGLQAETQYSVVITAFPVSNLCPDLSTAFTFMTSQRCPSPPPLFSGSPIVQPGVVRVSWAAAGSSDPLVTGIRYALYSQCGAETTFQLIDDISGLSYDITTLPTLTQCVLRVVVYSDHCLLDVNGPLEDTTDPFTTVCPINEYVGGTPEACQPCPANSSSPGGVVRICPCFSNTGRVNESVPSLPCVACPGPPLNPMVPSSVPPNIEVRWDRPSTPDMWAFVYRVDWPNGTSAVDDTEDPRGVLSGLEAARPYDVNITAFTDSTLCPAQSINFTFNTAQRCPSPPPMFSGPPTLLPSLVRVSWTAAGSSDPLVVGVRYALYSQCGSQTTFQLIDVITGLSYDITTLPTLTQCMLRVVVYSDHCLLDVDGPLEDTTDPFTTVCPVNEYVGGAPEACQPCPAMSSSPGGLVRVCPCMDGTGRVDDISDPSLPCVACPGAPLNARLPSNMPPNVNMMWDEPSTPDAWTFQYRVNWQNGTAITNSFISARSLLVSGLSAATQYALAITAYPTGGVCPNETVGFTFTTSQRCPNPAPMFRGLPMVLAGAVYVSWTAAGSSDPLVTGIGYALYSQCGVQTAFQLINDIQGLSYNITILPTLTQCVLRVVVYSDHCLLDVDGSLEDTTDPFTTVCPPNEYVGGSPEACRRCPTGSSSPGRVVRACSCMEGTGRVDESDPALPCVACPGPPRLPMVASPVPPNVDLLWTRPDTPDRWSFMYMAEWLSESVAVGEGEGTRAVLSGLEPVTEYAVTITAFTDSTLCEEQRISFVFHTTQRCPDIGPKLESAPKVIPGSVTITWQDIQTNDPLLFDTVYAIYSRCEGETSYKLVAEDIEGLSYTITSLPAPSKCILKVVAYHQYCLRDLDGKFQFNTAEFITAIEAPAQPPPPNVTVSDGMFSIDELDPLDIVVEYVCQYTSVITDVTLQVKVKPSEVADVPLERSGGYMVQCAGVNADKFQGVFSEPVFVTVEAPAEPRCDRIDILTVALTVIAVVVFVIVLIALAAYVLNWRNKHKRREARMQPM